MIEFETYSGSLYQVDTERRTIRRVSGSRVPIPIQGNDGEWQPYSEVVGDIVEGRRVFVVFTNNPNRYMQTSYVTAVREVDAVDP